MVEARRGLGRLGWLAAVLLAVGGTAVRGQDGAAAANSASSPKYNSANSHNSSKRGSAGSPDSSSYDSYNSLNMASSLRGDSASSADSAGSSGGPVVLDSVIAVINGDVLLRSDLRTEMNLATLEPLSLPAGRSFERRAARRLIDRTLILQQMESQGMVKEISDEAVAKDLDALREQLPECRRFGCETAAGWAKFLAAHDLTAPEVEASWRQRMQILAFIDTRFRAGVRISKPDIEDYYNKTLVPEFEKQKTSAPALDAVSGRIEEVLLQQHVSALLQDWLKSLRDQGSVIILDPALGQSNPGPDDEEGDGA